MSQIPCVESLTSLIKTKSRIPESYDSRKARLFSHAHIKDNMRRTLQKKKKIVLVLLCCSRIGNVKSKLLYGNVFQLGPILIICV